MVQEIIKNVIFDQHEVIKNFDIIDRAIYPITLMWRTLLSFRWSAV